MIMDWMKSHYARKQATNILKMIEYLQNNEIAEYEKMVEQKKQLDM